VLTKSDLHPDPEAAAAEVETIAFGVPVLVVSAPTGAGLDAVADIVRRGRTLVLLGSSGVGKSTLVNTLAGEELLATNELRDDGRGRHTTTHRQLVVLPSGGLVIDTPGLRELQLWEVGQGVEHSFEDVTELFQHCRFNDCAHDREPGCAVRAALEDGTLDPVRWDSYLKLQRELAHLERRLDKRAQSEARREWAKRGADGREAMRLKGRR
jgi:ribosome biogenesis GTPase